MGVGGFGVEIGFYRIVNFIFICLIFFKNDFFLVLRFCGKYIECVKFIDRLVDCLVGIWMLKKKLLLKFF